MRIDGAGMRPAGWLALAVCLGLLGAALDQFHVQSELLSLHGVPLALDVARRVTYGGPISKQEGIGDVDPVA
jgi:hypothetical protein